MKRFLHQSILKGLIGLSVIASLSIPGLTQSFSLSVSPTTITIHPGDQNVPVTINVGSSAYAGPINITLTGLPSGITVSPLTLNAGSSGTLKISASVSADQEGFNPQELPTPDSKVNSVTVLAVAGSATISTPMTLTVSLSNPTYEPSPSQINLPIVTINTDGQPVVSKTVDVSGTITITSADGQTSYLPNSSDSDNTATFHVHGTSTSVMPKLPYEFKLGTSIDLLHTMGLSCPYTTSSGKPTCDKSKTYILLANYDDKTFLRDWAASALANAIPIGNGYLGSSASSPSPSGSSTLMPWAPHSLFVEVYLNGVYEGNYQLIEKVNVDSHRINISELSETDTTDDITGGYLMEIDEHQDEAYVFHTPVWNVPIGLIDPDFSPDPEVPEQTSYISSYVDAAEQALAGSNFTDPTLGWRAYFDEASAVNFYIVNDVMGNNDGGAFYSSDYLYKDKDNPLLYMGPVWDFDISSGNDNENVISNPTVPWMQTRAIWYQRWFQDPGFKADLVTQWNALKNNGVFSAWIASIQQEAATLQQSQANNFGRWPMQGIEVWPNSEAAGSYNAEVSYMTNWLNLRIAYLDSLFNGKPQTSTILNAPTGNLRNGSPVSLSAIVRGSTTPTGNVFFLSNGLVVGAAPLDGNGNASLTTSLPAGTDNLEAVYNGDDKNGLSASAVMPVTVAAPLVTTFTSLTSSVSSENPALPATFTVLVLANAGTTIPTGTVTYQVSGQSGGTATLSSSGSATFSVAQFSTGTNTVQAFYSGDSTYQASSSNVATYDEVPDFTLGVSSPLITIERGKPAAVNLVITPQNGFSQKVSLSCGAIPLNMKCSFAPATVALGGAPVNSTLTISETNESAHNEPLCPPWTKYAGGIVLALLVWPMRRRRRIYLRAWSIGMLAVIVLAGLAMSGCQSASPTTHVITVTASGGNISHSTSVTIQETD